MGGISDALQGVKSRLDAACLAAGRPAGDVALLAVSKTFPADTVREAFDAGQRAFGENYVQELTEKSDALATLPIEWHFIGPLQSNKTRPVAECASWVHAIDRLKIAERLSAQRPEHLPPLQVCIEVNVSGETTKHGVAPAEVLALARQVAALPRLQLRGLMAIPAPADDLAGQRVPLRALRELFDQLIGEGLPLDTLSMGMSADLEAAVLEGATMVRIGSAIFGSRPRPASTPT